MPIEWEKGASGKGRWRFQFNRIINGRRFRASKLLPKGTSREQADKYDEKETARIFAEARGLEQPKRLVSEAVKFYVLERCPLNKDGQKAQQELELIFDWYKGKALDELQEISKLYASENKHLAPATIRNRLAYLRAAVRYGYKHHNIGDRDYTDKMVFPTVRNERHVYKDRADVLRLMRACKDLETRAIIKIAFYTGLRWREGILKMTPKSIKGDLFSLGRLKNGKPHTVPIHPKLICYLKRIPFQKHDRQYYGHFEKAREAAGMSEVTMHTLRHSLASELLTKHGANLRQVAEVLGHTSLQATNRYAHMDIEGRRELLNQVGTKRKAK